MESKTYSGEYSLKHWIQLMLKGNIILPEYQRSFVWNESDIERLIVSIRNGQFIPPVTIARMNGQGGVNLILDGQQRLSSLLLFVLGYFPIREEFLLDNTMAQDAYTEEEETEQNINGRKIIGWNFHKLLKQDKDKNEVNSIQHRLAADPKYHPINFNNLECNMTAKTLGEFLENNYLGFCYVVPQNATKEEEQKYFSTLFRNMNYMGRKLSTLESRRSLYFMDDKLKNYFEGKMDDGSDVLSDIRIIESMTARRIDFTRYLAILSQYYVLKKADRVMTGYSALSSRENFYVDYVSYILGLEQEDRTDKFNGFDFNAVLGEGKWQVRFSELKDALEALKDYLNLDPKETAFKSWIDADYWLFGLIYWILFEGKEFQFNQDFVLSIQNTISKRKKDHDYIRQPNSISNIRNRIRESVTRVKRFIK